MVLSQALVTLFLAMAPAALARSFPVAPGIDEAASSQPFPFEGAWSGLVINFGDLDEMVPYEVNINFGEGCTSYNAKCATTRYPPSSVVGEFSITAPVVCQPYLSGNNPTGRCFQFKEDYSFDDELEVPFRISFINLSEQADDTLYWTFMQGTIATAWGYLQPGDMMPPSPTSVPPSPTSAPPSPTSAPPSPTSAPPSPTAAPPSGECPYDGLSTCIAACPVALPIYQECIEQCVELCGSDAQQNLFGMVNTVNVIQPEQDTLPKGADFALLGNGWPAGSGGNFLTSNATTYFGIDQGSSVRVSLPFDGCPPFNFLDFENPCGAINFSDGGENLSLSYNMKVQCLDATAGPSPAGTCYQFLSADVDALVENPDRWDENSLRFYTLSAQTRTGGQNFWFTWTYGAVTKMDGSLGISWVP